MHVALIHYFNTILPKKNGLYLFIREQVIKDSVDKILCTPNVKVWDEEQNNYQIKKLILQSIQNVKRFNEKNLSNDDLYNSQVDMQRVCAYLIESLVTASALKTLRITSINFSYTLGKHIKVFKINILD